MSYINEPTHYVIEEIDILNEDIDSITILLAGAVSD